MKAKVPNFKPTTPAPKAAQPAVTSTKVLTPTDIAKLLGISYESALAFIKNSGVEYLKLGRQYRVAEDKLRAFLARDGCVTVDLT